MMLRTRLSARGVTLIELLVVLAVMCVSLGIARTAMTAHSMRELTSACYELQADLRYAQRQAVTENRKYQVLFPLTKNGYTILRHEGELGISSVVKDRVFDNGVKLAGTTAVSSSVTYTARGTTGDACTITLNNDGYYAELTVSLGSGRIAQKKFGKLTGY